MGKKRLRILEMQLQDRWHLIEDLLRRVEYLERSQNRMIERRIRGGQGESMQATFDKR